MRLFVENPETREKIFLKVKAKDRTSLVKTIGARHFSSRGKTFSVNDVQAEASDNTAPTMALGGVIGVAAGVPGVIIGGLLGGLMGKQVAQEEEAKATAFNGSCNVEL